jgi:hypothetical protein
MAKAYYSLFDADGGILGRWDGAFHYVGVYEKRSQAKADMDTLKATVPGVQIGSAYNAAYASPSAYSAK